MNIGQLEYLVATINLGSYASAAKKFYVSTQAVSKSVKDLERELGVALFVKDGRGLAPTSFAREFANRAEDLLSGLDDLKAFAVEERVDLPETGCVTLAVASSYLRGSVFDESMLASVRKDHPKVQVQVQRYEPDSCLAVLEAGIADGAIIVGKPQSPLYSSVKIGTVETMLAVKQNTYSKDGSGVYLGALSGCLAIPSSVQYTYCQLKDCSQKAGYAIKWQYVPPTIESHLAFIVEGGAILVTGNALIASLGERVELAPLAEDSRMTLPVYFVQRAADMPGPAALVLRSLQRAFGALTNASSAKMLGGGVAFQATD